MRPFKAHHRNDIILSFSWGRHSAFSPRELHKAKRGCIYDSCIYKRASDFDVLALLHCFGCRNFYTRTDGCSADDMVLGNARCVCAQLSGYLVVVKRSLRSSYSVIIKQKQKYFGVYINSEVNTAHRHRIVTSRVLHAQLIYKRENSRDRERKTGRESRRRAHLHASVNQSYLSRPQWCHNLGNFTPPVLLFFYDISIRPANHRRGIVESSRVGGLIWCLFYMHARLLCNKSPRARLLKFEDRRLCRTMIVRVVWNSRKRLAGN